MNRYLLFVFDRHSPAGGWNDFVGSLDSLESALLKANFYYTSRWQIVDTLTMQLVADDIAGICSPKA